MTYETILTEKRDQVTLITLNRPKSLNALNSQVLDELIDAFSAFQAQPYRQGDPQAMDRCGERFRSRRRL